VTVEFEIESSQAYLRAAVFRSCSFCLTTESSRASLWAATAESEIESSRAYLRAAVFLSCSSCLTTESSRASL